MRNVKTLGQGDSFGELSLLKEGVGTRAASIISMDSTFLAYVDRDTFRKIMSTCC